MKQTILLTLLLIYASCATQQKISPVSYNTTAQESTLCDFMVPNPATDSGLVTLNHQYQLPTLVASAQSDTEQALILLNWTHRRWKHNGSNTPSQSDALTILEEAAQGQQFRCVEYGIVLSETLNATGIPARVLRLRTKDVETTKYGAGHVVAEAYLPDLNKWVFMDGQMNYVPFLNGIPLNAVEYQQAIAEHQNEVELRNTHGAIDRKEAKGMMKWVEEYLFYFTARFDATAQNTKCQGKSQLMLVPLGAKNPTVFQRNDPIDYCLYTNNEQDFYRKPVVH